MKHRLTFCALPLILLIGLSPRLVSATTVQRFGIDQLTANAARIFVGRCTAATPELAHGQIYTRFEFDVEDVLKGAATRQIEVSLAGGVLQGVHYRIVGMPTFQPGERVVLFLTEKDARGNAWPVGLGQGKFAIDGGPTERSARVRQSLSSGGVDLLTLEGDVAAKPAKGELDASGMQLAEFLSLVRSLVDRDEGGADAR